MSAIPTGSILEVTDYISKVTGSSADVTECNAEETDGRAEVTHCHAEGTSSSADESHSGAKQTGYIREVPMCKLEVTHAFAEASEYEESTIAGRSVTFDGHRTECPLGGSDNALRKRGINTRLEVRTIQ